MCKSYEAKDPRKNCKILPNQIVVPKVNHDHIFTSETVFLLGIKKDLFSPSFNNNLLLSVNHDVFGTSAKWKHIKAIVVNCLGVIVDPVGMKHVLAAEYSMNREPSIERVEQCCIFLVCSICFLVQGFNYIASEASSFILIV